MAWRLLLSPNTHIFFKYRLIGECKKYFDLQFCVIVPPRVSWSGKMKQLITGKHKQVVFFCRFSLWKPADFPSEFCFLFD